MIKNIPDTGIDRETLAYIIGVAIGDGNLSNPNGRAPRLRITCDRRYPLLIQKICAAIQILLPKNKINIIKRSTNCIDISSYSKLWEKWLCWKAGKGSKFQQNVCVPGWILGNERFCIPCLRGLIETDGSIYFDRGYRMVNFVTTIPRLASNVVEMITRLNFQARLYTFKSKHKLKYTVRICRNVSSFIQTLELKKRSIEQKTH